MVILFDVSIENVKSYKNTNDEKLKIPYNRICVRNRSRHSVFSVQIYFCFATIILC